MEPITFKFVCREPGDWSVGIPNGEFTVEVKVECEGDAILNDPEQMGYFITDMKKLLKAYLDNGAVLTEAEAKALDREEEEAFNDIEEQERFNEKGR